MKKNILTDITRSELLRVAKDVKNGDIFQIESNGRVSKVNNSSFLIDENEIEGGELDNGQANFGKFLIDMAIVLAVVIGFIIAVNYFK